MALTPSIAPTHVAPARSAARRIAISACGGMGPSTVVRPRRSTPAFSPAISASVRPQVLLVVHADGDDGGGQRLRGVGGVQAAAHPHLEHGHVHPPRAEMEERGRGQRLEEGGMRVDAAALHQALGGAANAGHRVLEGAGRDLLAADGDALVHAHEVGGRVAPGAEPRGAEPGVHVRRHRPLAVGARDEQRGIGELRPAQLLGEGADGVQPELDAEPRARLEVRLCGRAPARGTGHGRG